MKRQWNPSLIVLLVMIIIAGLFRYLTASDVLAPWSNFSPIGAIALFSGYYFQRSVRAYIVPVLVLAFSDFFINYKVTGEWGLWYEGWFWVYGSFMLMVWIGRVMMTRVNGITILMASIGVALSHWLLTNLGVWLGNGLDSTTGHPYTRDIEGFLRCYWLAIPFMRNLLVGTLVYGGIMFWLFEWIQKKVLVTVAKQ